MPNQPHHKQHQADHDTTVASQASNEYPSLPKDDTLGRENNNAETNSALSNVTELFTLAHCVLAQPLETSRLLARGINQSTEQILGQGFNSERDIADQSNKVILVTGGNGGLGKQVISQLARHRPKRIYLTARNEAKAKDAIDSIQSELALEAKEGGGGGGDEGISTTTDIRYIQLDLASFKSIRAAAAFFIEDCDRLDTLILNAGIMGLPPLTTEDGYEIQFGTNYMGHFLLTQLLLPTLQRTAKEVQPDVRVLSISSIGHHMAPLPPSLLKVVKSTPRLLKCNRWTRYGVSKAANILFAAELARRYPEIKSVAVHPGVILTALYDSGRASNFIIRHGIHFMKLFAASERKGAWNHIWAAGVAGDQLVSGEYYTPIGVKGWGNPFVHDETAGRDLWEWTERELNN
ncbi:hypothetical protein FQN57_003140 [Myotisia sp. PD_48]|nr:hypothetical protein FQN57_003140 [Myotisia sp. PD_48]